MLNCLNYLLKGLKNKILHKDKYLRSYSGAPVVSEEDLFERRGVRVPQYFILEMIEAFNEFDKVLIR